MIPFVLAAGYLLAIQIENNCPDAAGAGVNSH
jgi:hypothetical protein